MHSDTVWDNLLAEAKEASKHEPALDGLLGNCILECHSLEESISFRLARKLGDHAVSAEKIKAIFLETFEADPNIGKAVRSDILAVRDRDPACDSFLSPVLFFKGFQALTSYRIAHHLWKNDRTYLALYLQSLISETFAVDIHPAARIGSGILLDHATSFVVGETAVIDDNVSILHEVTLGGTGKSHGDRHPKIRSGVLIGAGAKILGNVEIGEGAKIGAGSVVLGPVAPHTTVAGVPAKLIGKATDPTPAFGMDHNI